MTGFKKVLLQFLGFFAANFFGITTFVLVYFFSGPAYSPVEDFLEKASTNTYLPYFIWGIVPFVISMFLVHGIYENVVFNTNGNLTPVEVFKEIIVFGFNNATIVILEIYLVNQFNKSRLLLKLGLMSLVYTFFTIIHYIVSRFWVFEKVKL